MADIDTILGISAEQAEFARIITALTAERDALLAFTPKNWRGELSAAIEDTAIKAEKIAKLTAERDALREALRKLAIEPFENGGIDCWQCHVCETMWDRVSGERHDSTCALGEPR
jgi:hypothetical protein